MKCRGIFKIIYIKYNKFFLKNQVNKKKYSNKYKKYIIIMKIHIVRYPSELFIVVCTIAGME